MYIIQLYKMLKLPCCLSPYLSYLMQITQANCGFFPNLCDMLKISSLGWWQRTSASWAFHLNIHPSL
uniref:Transmembrane E3 ubiquitin-protein ligase 1-like n=1 Tax=Rhizophora mucronata TaxID=61149 RepID=A0A2P2KWZ6_RHIMU